MGIFNNGLDGPPSTQKVTVYYILFGISFSQYMGDGQSFKMTFDFPIWISYFIGFLIVGIMAAMLTIIKGAIEDKSLIALVSGIFVFLLVWFVSLCTNSHSFYLQGSLKDIQEEELKEIDKDLNGLETGAENIIEKASLEQRIRISNAISNYKAEVSNSRNPGHGPVADSLKLQVERLIPGTQFVLKSGNWTGRGRELSEIMGGEMTQSMDDLLSSYEEKKSDIAGLITKENLGDLINEITDHLGLIYDKSTQDNRSLISNAWQRHNKVGKQICDILNIPSPCQFQKEDTPGSIELENISNTYKYVKSTGGFATNEFLFALLLALGIDLAAFMIYWKIS